MTEQQWETCNDAYLMIDYIWRLSNIPQSPLLNFGGDMNRIYDSGVELYLN